MNELKVLIKPILDKSSANRVKSQMSSSSGGGGGGMASDKGMKQIMGKKGLGGLLGKATIATAVAGVSTYFLGKIVSSLARASPMLSGVLQQMKNAINLFLMPIGNMLATWLMPLSMDMTKFAINFNKVFGEKGYWHAMAYALTEVFSKFMKPLTDQIKEVVDTIIPPGTGGASTQSIRNDGTVGYNTGIHGAWDRLGDAWRDTTSRIGGLIPFASGGIVTGPTPALVGEAGPEAIIPLDKLNQGVTINIVGDVFGMPDFEQRVLTAVNRASGNRRYYA